MKKWTTQQMPKQHGKRVLITGANSGIGLGTATELARKGAAIILAVRDTQKGEAARRQILSQIPTAEISIEPLDLADLDSVRACARSLKAKYSVIDILINNAGVMMPKQRTLSAQGYEIQLATNHFGHFVLTHELLPLLEKSEAGRIVVVASIITNMKAAAIYFDDIQFEHSYQPMASYAQSKLANLMFLRDLANHLNKQQSSVKVIGAHPGYTATNLQRHMGIVGTIMNTLMAQPISMGILPSLRAATDPGACNGDYFGPVRFSGYRGYPERCKMTPLAADTANRQKLWQLTEQLTGTVFGTNMAENAH